MVDKQIQLELLRLAKDSTKKSYAPYSSFRVGAALLTETGNYYQGCNIENASYGLTICAERVAISNAVVNEKSNRLMIEAIAIVNDKGSPCSPCGSCRQFIYEFGSDSIVIFKGENDFLQISIQNLLPFSFSFAKC